MSGRFGDDIIYDWITEILAMDTLYGALFAGNPFVAGLELTDPDYHRVELVLQREADNLLSNAERLVWTGILAGSHIAWVGAYDEDIGGRLVAAAPLPMLVEVDAGGIFPLNAGEFVMGLDVAAGP